jgi:hypothetical protein
MGPQVVPSVLFFLIKKNGNRLEDTVLNYMNLYYFKSGVKTFIRDFSRGINEGPFPAYDLGVQGTREIGDVSGDNNIKNFYLEYSNGDIDTLYVNYRHVGENEAFNNSCYCYYPLEGVKFNGVVASPDSTITTWAMVFRFDKN